LGTGLVLVFSMKDYKLKDF